MKIVLLKNIPAYGQEGDLIEVSDGYARNFLFPQNLAVQATPQNEFAAKEKKEKKVRDKNKELKKTAQLASALDGLEIEIRSKANAAGKFYAAVSGQEVAEAIRAFGHKVDSAWVEFIEPIKEIGIYEITVNLPHGFEAKLNVRVSAK